MRFSSRAGLLSIAMAAVLGIASVRAAESTPAEQVIVHWRMAGVLASPGPDALTRDDRQVIRDRATFRQVWARLHAAAAVVPPLPVIDFRRESVVIVPLDELAGVGTQALHEQLVDTGDRIRLTYVVELPGRDCEPAPAVTAPVLVLRTPRITKPVTFVEDRLVRDCQ